MKLDDILKDKDDLDFILAHFEKNMLRGWSGEVHISWLTDWRGEKRNMWRVRARDHAGWAETHLYPEQCKAPWDKPPAEAP